MMKWFRWGVRLGAAFVAYQALTRWFQRRTRS